MALPDFSKLTIREPTTIDVKPSLSTGGKPIRKTKLRKIKKRIPSGRLGSDDDSEDSRSLGSDSPRSDHSKSEASGSLDSDSHMSDDDYNSEDSRSLGSDSPRSDHSNSEASRTTKEELYEAEAESPAAADLQKKEDLQRQIDELTKKNKRKRAKLAKKYALKLRKDEGQLDESIPNNIQNDNEQMEPVEQFEEQLSKLSRYRRSHNGSGPRKSLRQGGLTFEPIPIQTLLEMLENIDAVDSQIKAWLEIKELLDKDKVTAQPSQPELEKIRTIICNLLKKYNLSLWESVISSSCESRAPPKPALKLDLKSWARLDSELNELSTNIRKLEDYKTLLKEIESTVICAFKDINRDIRLSTAFLQDKLRNGNNYLWMMHTTENNERVTLGFAVASRHFAKVGDHYSSIFHLEAICGKSYGYDMFGMVLQHAMNKTLTVNDQVIYQYDYFELEAINEELDAKYTAWVEKILSRSEKKQNEAPKFLKGLANVSIDDYNKDNKDDMYPRYLDLNSARKHL